jgi:hypothetical protein
MKHHDSRVRSGRGGFVQIGDQLRFVIFALEVNGFGYRLGEARAKQEE